MMNLFSGFIAITSAFSGKDPAGGDYIRAGWWIVCGGIFDMLDGIMARLTKTSSEFGVELDSLADVVTFGVAPSAILYKAFFHQFVGTGLLISALPAICGAIRLARFNVQLVGFDKDYFRGLPIPSAAILIISYVMFYHVNLPMADRMNDPLMWVVTIGASLMMVSTVKYDVVPKPSKREIKAHPLKFGLIFVGIVLVIVTKGKAMFPLFVLFVVNGIVRSLYHRVRRFLSQRRAISLLDEEELDREDERTFGG